MNEYSPYTAFRMDVLIFLLSESIIREGHLPAKRASLDVLSKQGRISLLKLFLRLVRKSTVQGGAEKKTTSFL